MSDNARLAALQAKKKLTGAERAELKALKRTQSNSTPSKADSNKAKNVFGIAPTTKINPKPVRFLEQERTGMGNRVKDIQSQDLEYVIEKLGRKDGVNETKLIRAAIYLLSEHSNKEIIDAIAEVQKMMIRG
ncbi:hypothetical protein [Motilimonas pumila]|uniref:Uncharacterized protein n=1 Tax=Motilimonas pumila TaxID=2303987 RepID=A0A418YA70_9GAMM|nr:hypothetical protein [Motilimonas pumila]RJG38988.1 hypothetical protein D1Z90_18620 [Motilimonas pumila]